MAGAWAPALAVMVVAVCYLSTLMWRINGSDSVYADDVGEYQVALPLWGTVHPTGTPLYMLLGSPFVSALRGVGLAPSAGASLFSLLWAAAGVALLAAILIRLAVPPVLSALAALAIGLTRSIWIHGSIAEVYSLWMFITLLALLLALKLDARWSDGGGWLLALFAGLGVAHHRLFAPLLLVLALWLWRRAPRGKALWRWGVFAAPAFAGGFFPYADMVLRARLGAEWIYGDPGSWAGFWSLFWAREYSGLQGLPGGLRELADALARSGSVLWGELRWPGLLWALLGVLLAMRAPLRRPATLLLGTALAYLLFAIALPRANFFEMAAMPVAAAVLLTATLGIGSVADSALGLRVAAAAALAVVTGWYVLNNRPAVLQITRDPAGVQAIAQLDDLNAPAAATIMSPWGRRHFALAYSTRVERRFPGWRVAHHAEDWREILQRESTVYTNADSIYGFGSEWWRETLRAEPYFSAAGPGWVAISLSPLPMDAERPAHLELASGMHLKGWTFKEQDGAFKATLCWQAVQSPMADYSTFVHLGSVAKIVLPEQLVASSDHSTPVDGWRPSGGWQREEVVCDAHSIALPPQAGFSHVIAGMYTRTESGGFEQLGALRWARAGRRWSVVR